LIHRVPDKRCNIHDRFLTILRDGYHIVKALLIISKMVTGRCFN